jgi:NADPH-dependent glutamate synthase beta subunit-like oxidoreductase
MMVNPVRGTRPATTAVEQDIHVLARPASVVVVGGGYGGINVAKALDDIANVTLVDPTEAFVHNVAAWRALVEPKWLERIFLPYERLLANGRFLLDRAVGVIEVRLGTALASLPSAPPATLAPIRIATANGEGLNADIWFRAFGVRPHTEYLEGGSLQASRNERGYVRVDEHLRVIGETNVFAVGDIVDADRDMAGIASVRRVDDQRGRRATPVPLPPAEPADQIGEIKLPAALAGRECRTAPHAFGPVNGDHGRKRAAAMEGAPQAAARRTAPGGGHSSGDRSPSPDTLDQI